MKLQIDCIPCLIKQSVQAIKKTGGGMEELKEILRLILEFDENTTSAGTKVHRALKEATGVQNIYAEEKKRDNNAAMKMLPRIREEMEGSEDRFLFATKAAIAGNVIDYGALGIKNLIGEVEGILHEELAIDDSKRFKEELKKAKRVIYLADNAGEIVFDQLLIDEIQTLGPKVTVAVRGEPILNDATMEDAKMVGLRADKIITTGTDHIGIDPTECSEDFIKEFEGADLVISKGQGNYETLQDFNIKKKVVYILRVKCEVVAENLKTKKEANIVKIVEA
ncbi:MAG: DUF89 family protein [Candidatus Altiarchaeota archaeon]|nr:DUF89 family protein [Candidatus Altiarchaeota archaeon]